MFRSCTGLNTRGLYPTHDPYVSKPIPLCTGTGSDGYGHGLPRKTPGQPVPFPKYVALTHSSKDIIWIRKLLFEFSSIISISSDVSSLFCDNQGAIRLSSDSTFHARTKHIDVYFHFIRQTVSQGHLILHYIPTHDMIADIFTKSLSFNKFTKFRSLLGLQ